MMTTCLVYAGLISIHSVENISYQLQQQWWANFNNDDDDMAKIVKRRKAKNTQFFLRTKNIIWKFMIRPSKAIRVILSSVTRATAR